MKTNTFKIIVGVLVVVYVLLFLSTPVQKQTFTFDVAEIVCMALSLACFYEVMQVLKGARIAPSLLKLEHHCILYAALGIIFRILSVNSIFVQ